MIAVDSGRTKSPSTNVGERPVGDHDARGMRADVTHRAFEAAGVLHHPPDLGVFLAEPLQRGLVLECLVERDV